MIVDKIENAGLYKNLGVGIAKALACIEQTDFSQHENGKVELEGKDLFYIVSEYETKDAVDCKLEAHKNYIDVQFIAAGIEIMGYVPYKNQTPSVAYNPEKDCVFFQEETSSVVVEAGMFAIFFPNDLHKPCIKYKEGTTVKKVVFKVKTQ